MRFIIIINLVLLSLIPRAQNSNIELIRSAFEKNYLIYKISEKLKKNELLTDNKLNAYSRIYSSDWLPNFDYRLIVNIKKTDIIYPDSTFKVYSIYIPREVYQSTLTNVRIEKHTTAHWDKFNKYYLIAINDENKIKYLSGAFFLDVIIDDFKLNNYSMESIEKYLKIRLYNYRFSSINFIKQTRKRIVYEALSNISKKKYQIILLKNNLDKIKVIEYRK